MIRLLGLGDNVCDIYLHTNTMYPGGQALNVAVYAAMLGAQSSFLGVHGTDAVAEHVLKTLTTRGVEHSHTRRYSGENGFACVSLVQGDRVFRGSNRGGVLQEHPLKLTAEDLDYMEQFQVIHTTNNGFLDDQLPLISRRNALVSYDFSYRWNEPERIERVSPYVDIAFLSASNLHEVEALAVCREIVSRGCRVAVATRGEQATIVWDGEQVLHQEVQRVVPVDTMGAGDSFAACMLVELAGAMQAAGITAFWQPQKKGEILRKAMRKAAAFAAQTCLVNGAFGCGVPVPLEMKPAILRVLQ